MSIPTAHPYGTRDDFERRARQRKRLAQLPDSLVINVARLGAATARVKDATRGLLEDAVRDAADTATAEIADDLDRYTRWNAAKAVHNLIVDAGELRSALLERSLSDLEEKAVDDQRVNSSEDHFRLDENRQWVVLAALLIWADELSPDDYTDPRVASARAPGDSA